MTHDNPHDRVADAVHEGRPVEAQYVRQGRGGVRIFTVLAVSVALVVIGFAVVWAFWAGPFAADRANTGLQDVDAAAFQGEGGDRTPAADAPTTATGQPTNPAGAPANVNAPTLQAPAN